MQEKLENAVKKQQIVMSPKDRSIAFLQITVKISPIAAKIIVGGG